MSYTHMIAFFFCFTRFTLFYIQLLDQLDPEVKSKMDLHWYSIRHTAESKKLWIEQMCKHGYLSCGYWEKAIEAAMPFLSSNGIFNIMNILKEEMSGDYTSQEF